MPEQRLSILSATSHGGRETHARGTELKGRPSFFCLIYLQHIRGGGTEGRAKAERFFYALEK